MLLDQPLAPSGGWSGRRFTPCRGLPDSRAVPLLTVMGHHGSRGPGRPGLEPDASRYDPCMPYANAEDQRRYARAHYDAHKDAYKARAAAHRRTNQAAATALIRKAKDKPCADCGARYPYYVMQFDHLPGESKNFTIGAAGRIKLAVHRIAAEIRRCDVVCANCHAERTHQRGYRYGVRVSAISTRNEQEVLF